MNHLWMWILVVAVAVPTIVCGIVLYTPKRFGARQLATIERLSGFEFDPPYLDTLRRELFARGRWTLLGVGFGAIIGGFVGQTQNGEWAGIAAALLTVVAVMIITSMAPVLVTAAARARSTAPLSPRAATGLIDYVPASLIILALASLAVQVAVAVLFIVGTRATSFATGAAVAVIAPIVVALAVFVVVSATARQGHRAQNDAELAADDAVRQYDIRALLILAMTLPALPVVMLGIARGDHSELLYASAQGYFILQLVIAAIANRILPLRSSFAIPYLRTRLWPRTSAPDRQDADHQDA